MKPISPVYKNTFGSYLIPLGFINLKGSDFFLRIVNNNILQFICLKKDRFQYEGYKTFIVVAGVRSIFAESMEKDHLLFSAIPLAGFASDQEHFSELLSIRYNETTVEEAVNYALHKTVELIMPQLDSVTDLDSCIEFYKRYRIDMIRWADRFAADSLLLIKSDNHDTFMKEFQEELDSSLRMLEKGEMGGDYNYIYDSLHTGIIETIAEARNKVFTDPELYERAMAEMEKRQITNLAILKSYGLIV